MKIAKYIISMFVIILLFSCSANQIKRTMDKIFGNKDDFKIVVLPPQHIDGKISKELQYSINLLTKDLKFIFSNAINKLDLNKNIQLIAFKPLKIKDSKDMDKFQKLFKQVDISNALGFLGGDKLIKISQLSNIINLLSVELPQFVLFIYSLFTEDGSPDYIVTGDFYVQQEDGKRFLYLRPFACSIDDNQLIYASKEFPIVLKEDNRLTPPREIGSDLLKQIIIRREKIE